MVAVVQMTKDKLDAREGLPIREAVRNRLLQQKKRWPGESAASRLKM
ncbi:MAG TPA: hypothetical protein VNM72_06200 [Blastocatellia bacterium]|nr:hypothetical protein [Blastocatellia bacterium]